MIERPGQGHGEGVAMATLDSALGRAVASALLFAGSAWLVHRSAAHGAFWQFVAMAVAGVPQVLFLVTARADASARARVRVTRRPMPLYVAIAAVLLGLGAATVLRAGWGSPVGLACLLGGVAATVAALPPFVAPLPRGRR